MFIGGNGVKGRIKVNKCDALKSRMTRYMDEIPKFQFRLEIPTTKEGR